MRTSNARVCRPNSCPSTLPYKTGVVCDARWVIHEPPCANSPLLNCWHANGGRRALPSSGASERETVLLTHGEPSWSYLNRNLVPPLLDQGYVPKVLAAPTLPSTSLSSLRGFGAWVRLPTSGILPACAVLCARVRDHDHHHHVHGDNGADNADVHCAGRHMVGTCRSDTA